MHSIWFPIVKFFRSCFHVRLFRLLFNFSLFSIRKKNVRMFRLVNNRFLETWANCFDDDDMMRRVVVAQQIFQSNSNHNWAWKLNDRWPKSMMISWLSRLTTDNLCTRISSIETKERWLGQKRGLPMNLLFDCRPQMLNARFFDFPMPNASYSVQFISYRFTAIDRLTKRKQRKKNSSQTNWDVTIQFNNSNQWHGINFVNFSYAQLLSWSKL